MRLLFKNFCPNCGGNISNERLEAGTLCSKCLAKPVNKPYLIWKYLKEQNKVKEYKTILRLNYHLSQVRKLFKVLLGSYPTSLQEVWIKRVLSRRSFSIIAPTGIGKSTFGLIMSIYLAQKGRKIYMMFPTSLLVQQTETKLRSFLEKLNSEIGYASYHAGLKQKEKRLMKEKIANGDFNILITTDRFIVSNFGLLEDKKFDMVFVDDVDSFLKSAKNIDRIIKILGGDEKLLEIALKKIGKEEVSEDEQAYLERMSKKLGLIIFSSATAKQRRTKKIRVFKELFKFDLGFKPEFVRNIDDYFLKEGDMKAKLVELIKLLGSGGLIFVPLAGGKEKIKELESLLAENNIRFAVYDKPKREIIEKFKNSEIEVLLGIASARSPLARGLDLPETIRYALFFGVPRMEISLSTDTYIPSKLMTMTNLLMEVVDEKQRLALMEINSRLKKIATLRKEEIEKLERGEIDSDFLAYAEKVIKHAQSQLSSLIANKEIMEKIRQSKELRLKEENGNFKVIVADAVAYLQASGRTSRLYIGGVSKGLCILLVDDEKAFYGLKRKIEYFIDDFEFKEFSQQEVMKTKEQVDRDRELIRKAVEGRLKAREMKEFIKASLIIVESPTKARTIARLFGRAAKRQLGSLTVNEIPAGNRIINVVASVGHVLDLVENEGFDGVIVNEQNGYEFLPIYDSIKKCRKCGEQFVGYNSCPKCGSGDLLDKRDIINELRNLALEVNEVIIATDADAEGEKIGYDIYVLLKPYNQNIRRMEFHEVTRKAIKEALSNLRDIDKNLVNAQILRRIEDRWIGFELSKVLMRKFRQGNLSAGRVQTPVLGWIIEKTRESRKKINVAVVKAKNTDYVFYFRDVDPAVKDEKTISLDVEEFEAVLNPQPPFTTDTMIREASRVLKFSTAKTMRIAQQLFELGLITYHRTDSTQVSSFGINVAKKYLEDKGLLDLFQARSYRAEGAHECIRPTRPIDAEQLKRLIAMKIFVFPVKLTNEHYMLYDLIFRRFIASQCKPANVVKQKVRARLANYESEAELTVEIKEEGFLKFQKIKVFSKLTSGSYEIEELKLLKVSKEKPFTQGEIVATMKERGIGRPSTYAKIVSTILERKYAKDVKGFVVSTKRGEMVYEFLVSNFYDMVNEEVTRKLEEEMDMIEQGKASLEEAIKKIYEKVRRDILQRSKLLL